MEVRQQAEGDGADAPPPPMYSLMVQGCNQWPQGTDRAHTCQLTCQLITCTSMVA